MNIIKFLIMALFALIATGAFAQTVELKQKVKLREDRKQLSFDPDDKSKDVSRGKTFEVNFKNPSPTGVIMILFVFKGGDISYFVEKGSAKPGRDFKYISQEFVATSSAINIAFKKYGWGDDYVRKYGNDKVEACVFVFNQNGKYFGTKSTSANFGSDVAKIFKDLIREELAQNIAQ